MGNKLKRIEILLVRKVVNGKVILTPAMPELSEDYNDFLVALPEDAKVRASFAQSSDRMFEFEVARSSLHAYLRKVIIGSSEEYSETIKSKADIENKKDELYHQLKSKYCEIHPECYWKAIDKNGVECSLVFSLSSSKCELEYEQRMDFIAWAKYYTEEATGISSHRE